MGHTITVCHARMFATAKWFAGVAGFLPAAALAKEAQSPEQLLPDYDCIRPRARELLDWARWLEKLQEPEGEGWLAISKQPLSILEDSSREQALEECPLGLLTADILRMLACFDKGHECSGTFERLVRQGVAFFGLRVLMGTRWPIYESLHSDVWDRLGRQSDVLDMACEEPGKNILDWAAFKKVFLQQDWYQPAVDVAYGPELEVKWREAAKECPLGFATANLIKAMLCSHTESICFRAHATMLGAVLEEIPLPRIAHSGWPLLHLLGYPASIESRVRYLQQYLDWNSKEGFLQAGRYSSTNVLLPLSVSLCLYLSLFVCLSVYPSQAPSIYLSICLSVYRSISLSLALSLSCLCAHQRKTP